MRQWFSETSGSKLYGKLGQDMDQSSMLPKSFLYVKIFIIHQNDNMAAEKERICCCVSKQGRLKGEWDRKLRPNFALFDPCKIREGEANCLSQFFFSLGPNLWYTFGGRPLRRLKNTAEAFDDFPIPILGFQPGQCLTEVNAPNYSLQQIVGEQRSIIGAHRSPIRCSVSMHSASRSNMAISQKVIELLIAYQHSNKALSPMIKGIRVITYI